MISVSSDATRPAIASSSSAFCPQAAIEAFVATSFTDF
jgi:hypothetical protein